LPGGLTALVGHRAAWLARRGYHSTFDRGFVPRPPNRTPGYGRFGGYHATLGRGVVLQPADRYAGNRPGEGSSRPYQTRGVGYARWPALEAYNHIQPPSVGRSNTVVWAPAAERGQSTAVRCEPIARRRPPLRAPISQRGLLGLLGRGLCGLFPQAGPLGWIPSVWRPALVREFPGGGHAPKSFRGGRNFSSRHSGGAAFWRHSGGHSSGKTSPLRLASAGDRVDDLQMGFERVARFGASRMFPWNLLFPVPIRKLSH